MDDHKRHRTSSSCRWRWCQAVGQRQRQSDNRRGAHTEQGEPSGRVGAARVWRGRARAAQAPGGERAVHARARQLVQALQPPATQRQAHIRQVLGQQHRLRAPHQQGVRASLAGRRQDQLEH